MWSVVAKSNNDATTPAFPTARSRISGRYRFDLLDAIPASHGMNLAQNPVRFSTPKSDKPARSTMR